ncbi:MAG: hypothetical protein ABI685_08710 [Ferruginibacter sp.]
MKKYFCTFCFALFISCSFAQTKNINSILIRHDTTLLKADECEWIVKSLIKNDPALTSAIGKEVSLIIMNAIAKGKLKAIDPETNKPIPAKEIFTWKMTGDTIPEYDMEGNIKRYLVVKREHSSDNLNQVRVYQDWYFDVSTGKFNTVIKWIELMEDISSNQGIYLGKAALCRIYY